MVELGVAMVVAMVISVMAYRAIYQITAGDKGSLASARRRADRAIQQSQVMELLLRDLRSATELPPAGTESFTMTRWVPGPDGALVEQMVTWEKRDDVTIVRTAEGERPRIFSFEGLLEEQRPVLEFRVEPVTDVLFDPMDAELGS
jgi:hypothetical protein